jgi:hypothetical protein
MNFLERIFALSPDGGSGSTEVLLLSVLACGLAAVFARTLYGRSMRSVFKLKSHAE